MRSVVVLPQPEGPSRQKNSPSRTVKVESFTATKSAKALCRFCDADLGHVAAATAGNLETIVNIATPASVVTNDQVKSTSANGCSIMKMPSAMTSAGRHLERPAAQPARPARVRIDAPAASASSSIVICAPRRR